MDFRDNVQMFKHTLILWKVMTYSTGRAMSHLVATRLCISQQLLILHQPIVASFFQTHAYLDTFVNSIRLDTGPARVHENIAFELRIGKANGSRDTETKIMFLVHIHALPTRTCQVHA